MKRRFLLSIIIILSVSILLTGCTVFPHKPSKKTVEKNAKQCINENVTIQSGAPQKHKVYAEVYYEYPFKDERGIDFNVIAATRNAVFVEPLPLIYSDSTEYRTDYKDKVFEHYHDEIDSILKSIDLPVYEYQITGQNGIIIKIDDTADFRKIAENIIKIDEILGYKYQNNAVTQDILSKNTYWHAYCSWDVLLQISLTEDLYPNGKPKSQTVSILFSDGYNNILSEESICDLIESGLH